DILSVDTVVADQRIGHGDDLPFVRRVGQNLLVPSHRGIKANLAAGGGARAECFTAEQRTIFESQNCFHLRAKRFAQSTAESAAGKFYATLQGLTSSESPAPLKSRPESHDARSYGWALFRRSPAEISL